MTEPFVEALKPWPGAGAPSEEGGGGSEDPMGGSLFFGRKTVVPVLGGRPETDEQRNGFRMWGGSVWTFLGATLFLELGLC